MAPREPRTQLRLPLLDDANAPSAPGRAGGPVLDARNATEYVEMTCRSILNFARGRHVSGCYTINPYRGCEFGCAYCYARYTHEFLEQREPGAFERRIFVKANAPEALARELRRKDVLAHGVSIGMATDPYQPAEQRFRLTRRILEALLPYEGIPISLVTKSGLVARDADVLGALARRHELTVLVSCITLDAQLQRALEPRAHTPERRFRAMRALVDAGVRTGLIIAPVLPGLTDEPAGLTALAARAAQAGASFVVHDVLYLASCSKRVFLPWLARHAPALLPRYEQTYARSLYERPEYRAEVRARIERATLAAGFAPRDAGNDDDS